MAATLGGADSYAVVNDPAKLAHAYALAHGPQGVLPHGRDSAGFGEDFEVEEAEEMEEAEEREGRRAPGAAFVPFPEAPPCALGAGGALPPRAPRRLLPMASISLAGGLPGRVSTPRSEVSLWVRGG